MPHSDLQTRKENLVTQLTQCAEEKKSDTMRYLRNLILYTSAIDIICEKEIELPSLKIEVDYRPEFHASYLQITLSRNYVLLISLYTSNLKNRIVGNVLLKDSSSFAVISEYKQIFDPKDIVDRYCVFADVVSALATKLIALHVPNEITWECSSEPNYKGGNLTFKTPVEFYIWLMEEWEREPADNDKDWPYKFNTPRDYSGNVLDVEYDVNDPSYMINWDINLDTLSEVLKNEND